MPITIRQIAALVIAGASLIPATAAPFANGGFEEAPVAPPETVETFTPVPIASAKVCPGPLPPGRIIQGNNNAVCSGWVRSGPGVVTRSRGSGNGYLPPVDGEHLIAFNSADTLTGAKISQTFSVMPGADYTVKFTFGSIVGVSATQLTARVATTGGTILASRVTGTAAGVTGWQPEQSFTFSAGAESSVVLSFEDTSLDTCSVDLLLDAVSISGPAPANAGGLTSFQGIWDLDGNLLPRHSCHEPLSAASFTPAYTSSSISGVPGTALNLPVLTGSQRLTMPNSAAPNGGPGATKVNQWSLVMDVKFLTVANYAGIFQTNPANTDDVDAWINGNGSLSMGGLVAPAGTFVANTWYRLALTAENNGAGGPLTLRVYINGVPTSGTGTSTFNGIHALQSSVLMFTDNNGETQPTQLNCLGFWNSTLSPADIASLGGPSAAGLAGWWNVPPCTPQCTISPTNRWAWGANSGWINGNWSPAAGDGGRGAVITEYTASGYLWSANLGWIHLGDGAPANGVRYSQTGSDYGVNHDGGALYGYAWCANAGWIYFGRHPNARPSTDRWQQDPRVDFFTGNLHGYAWSGNTGWVQLGTSGGNSRLVTNFNACGDDTDRDGIPDSWERDWLSAYSLPLNLATLGALSDHDGDGMTDREEYDSDTSPFDDSEHLEFISQQLAGDTFTAAWPSRKSRLYSLEISPDLLFWDQMTETWQGTGTAFTDGGTVNGPRNFFRVRSWSPFCNP